MTLKFMYFIFFLSTFSFWPNYVIGEAITLTVNMKQQIDLGRFNAATNYLDVAGNFNNWNGAAHRLTDDNNDYIYTITIDGFTVGETIEFKCRIDGAWDGREEFPNGGANRVYTIVAGENKIDIWYNDDIPEGENGQPNFSSNSRNILTESIVYYEDKTVGDHTVQWTFEGGNPSSSTDQNPKIKYDQSGAYNVEFQVQFDDGTSYNETFENYIQVSPREIDQVDWWNQTVFYEIYVRSFYDSDDDGIGDFEGLIEKLDYLNDGDPETTTDLGVTGIWLMPIHPSPSLHGYDVTNYLGIHEDYGSMEDFTRFLEEAHKRGIKVIIDFVMNHSSSEHEWFTSESASPQFSNEDYYRWSGSPQQSSGPWGQTVWHQNNSKYYYGLFYHGMPDLNYQNEKVKESMFNIAAYWLEDIGIDGFRLDAVKYIVEDNDSLEDTDQTIAFWKEYSNEIKSIKSDALSVGEAWTSTDRIQSYVHDERLDLCFEFDLAGQILHATKTRNVTALNSQIQKVYNQYPHLQFGTFLTNHDMNRVMSEFSENVNLMKTAAAIYLTLPGIPFIYYGEEVGMQGSKPDEFIRTPMQWNTNAHAGFSNSTPYISVHSDFRTANVAIQESDSNSLLEHYKKLIRIRQNYPALSLGKYEPIITDQEAVLAFRRYTDEESIVVIINASDQSQSVELDATLTSIGKEIYKNIFSDEEIAYMFTDSQMIHFELDPREIVIVNSSLSTATFDVNDEFSTIQITPNPSKDSIVIEGNTSVSGLIPYRMVNTKGQLVKQGTTRLGDEILINGFSQGLHFVQMQINGKSVTRQFIVID